MEQQSERSSGGSIQGLQWLQKAFAGFPGAVVVVDCDHRILAAMGSAFPAPGHRGAHAVGKTLEAYLSECVAGADLRADRILSALSGTPSAYEAWFGSRWYQVRAEPFHDANGNVAGVIALALDATERKVAQISLQQRDMLLRAATSEAQMLLVTRDCDDRITFAAGSLLAELGLDDGRLIGTRFEVLPGSADSNHPLIRAHSAARQGRRSDSVVFRRGDRIIEARVSPFSDEAQGISGSVAVWFDVTQQRRSEQLLRQRYASLELAAWHTPSALWAISRDGIVTMLTGRALESLRWDPAQMIGKPIEEALRLAGAPNAKERAEMHMAALDGNARSYETRWGDLTFTLHVKPVREADGEISGLVGIAYETTQQKELHERAAYLSNYDALTGVPNRVLLRELLSQALTLTREHGASASIAALDVDNFKRVNDSLGVDVGDRLIAGVARRICNALAPGDFVARSSGDEFIVVRPDTQDSHAPADLAKALLEIFQTPFQIGRHELFMRASIGMSVFPNDGDDAAQLLANADAALIQAKAHRRGSVQFFHRSLQAAVAERLTLEGDLRRALEKGQFELYYQPIFDVALKRVAGVEALIRWRHPVRGMIPPGAFIHVCEESGLIGAVGSWVIDEATRQSVQWSEAVARDFFIAVNVSPRQLDDELFETLRRALEKNGADPKSIELEVTESAIVKDGHLSVSEMRRLQSLGVRISIDDFGTGYSSLAYLKRLPVDSLKIDRLFVRDIADSPYDAAIARAIITLAQSIDLRVIAEGVETVEQRDLLEALSCRYMQGFLFSRPLPADAVLSAVGGA